MAFLTNIKMEQVTVDGQAVFFVALVRSFLTWAM